MSHRTRILDRMQLAQAELYRQILVDAGLDAEVVAGDLPGTDGWILVPDEQVPLAQAVLAEAQADVGGKRVCPGCGEENPGAFVDCWNCGASLEGDGSDAQRFEEPAGVSSTAGRLVFLGTVLALAAWALATWWFRGDIGP